MQVSQKQPTTSVLSGDAFDDDVLDRLFSAEEFDALVVLRLT